MNSELNFEKVGKERYAMVLEWFDRPHVREYFQGQGLNNTLVDLKKQVESGDAEWQHWICSSSGVPFGYLISSYVDESDSDRILFGDYMNQGETAITLDLFIGEEEFLGKGYAVPMIDTFLTRYFPDVEKVFIDPEVRNAKAIHVYEKAGFEKLREFIAEWNPVPHWLMVRELKG